MGGERTAKLNELMRIEEIVEGPEPEPTPEQPELKRAAKKKR